MDDALGGRAHTRGSSARGRSQRSRKRRRRRQLRRLALLVLLIVVLIVGLMVFEALQARSALREARGQAQQLSTEIAHGDLKPARSTVAKLSQRSAQARNNTGGLLWDAASHLPWLGRSVGAVQTSAATLDTIAQHALPTLMDLATRVENGDLSPTHGQLPLKQIAALAPALTETNADVQASARKLDRIDAAGLIGPLAPQVRSLQNQVASASSTLDRISRAVQVLPTAAGGEGPRNYLLLFQNNAEARSTGGMPGSWAILHADHGRLTMRQQGAAGDLDIDPPTHPPVKPTNNEKALYGSDLGTQLRDANINPNFPRFAEMAAGLVSQQTGTPLDGVFSVDPVALSFLLKGTGPVQVSHQRLTAGNVVPTLLNKVYLDLPDNAAQDAFFTETARKAFATVTGGNGSELDVIRGLVRGVAQRRVLAWSPRPDLARAIDGTALAGELTRDRPDQPQVGIFLDDGAASKLEFYLQSTTKVTRTTCSGTRQRVQLRTRLHSTAPAGDLPLSVTGPGRIASKGTMVLSLQIYGPVGGQIDSVSVDGKDQGSLAGGSIDGRQVAFLVVRVRPGQTRDLDLQITSGSGQDGDVLVTTTPGIEPQLNPFTAPSGCS